MNPDPVRFALTLAGAQARTDACRPAATVKVGLLLNPRARRLRARSTRSRLTGLFDSADVAQTRDLASLRRALALLLCKSDVNVLAIAGGDGTVHHAVNALMQLQDETEDALGIRPPLPRLLLLNGGTLNIVSRTMRSRGSPRDTLKRFLRAFENARWSQVPTRRMPTMLVQCGSERPRHGFVFGSEVLYHSIELYMRFGAGYSGLSRFLAELARGAVLGSDLWRAESWKLGPFGLPLTVDGRSYPDYAAVVASTVDLTLAVGRVRAIRRHELAPGFFAKVITKTSPRDVLQLVPSLVREGQVDGVRDHPTAQAMHLYGPITLDGELFGDTALPREQLPVHVRAAERRVHAVRGDLGAQRW